jgi:hypothetical protein
MEADSIVASTRSFAGSDSSRINTSRYPGEVAFHVGDHHVLDLELSRGMNRIDVPGGGGLCWSYCRVRHGRHPFRR